MNNRPTRTAAVLALTAALLLLPFAANAAEQMPAARPKPAIELGSPFADNAILQRQMPVPIWGWSKPGTKVTVEFAGQKKSATAGKEGKWMLKLDPLKASRDERELKVTGNGEAITRSGVLVGEVWFSSGQSSMDWVAGKSMCRELAGALQRSKEDVAGRVN